MLQLNPREVFTIVRQIEDHTDTNTYYVRAVVRNAKTDALLENVDLDSKGDQRYSKDYIVPTDVSGNGFWISIITSVYTNSGYTTKSDNYGDKLDTYLVQERYQFNPNYPIPVGPDIDYNRVRKIIKEEIAKIPPTEVKVPKAMVVTKEIIKEVKVPQIIENTKEVIKKVEVPKIIEVESKIDLREVQRLLSSVKEEIGRLKVKIFNKEIEKEDDEPVLSPIQGDRKSILLGNIEPDERVKRFI